MNKQFTISSILCVPHQKTGVNVWVAISTIGSRFRNIARLNYLPDIQGHPARNRMWLQQDSTSRLPKTVDALKQISIELHDIGFDRSNVDVKDLWRNEMRKRKKLSEEYEGEAGDEMRGHLSSAGAITKQKRAKPTKLSRVFEEARKRARMEDSEQDLE
ncbi:hypothetical protein BLNAU_2230 [Blattamonas nauphoetae]|uniref:Uncharacterized protein n=1 Tax=Blattamonas nauphoetae TaxID=2049346 RepID=A0ABQ9YGL1_9EUKA|nr:hypothetical protein BLNAU_2230 [Blattamonas nauphoetae]